MVPFLGSARRAAGLALAAALLTGVAYAQSGRAEVKGQVLAERPGEGSPRALAGATVELRSVRGGVAVARKAGEGGKCSFEGSPAGEYLLRVFAPGYALHEVKLYCARESVTQLTVRLERSLAGVAPGKQGPPRDPLPGAGRITWDVRVLEE